MKLIFFKKHYPLAILFLLILFYITNNYIWLKLNELNPFAGPAYHLLRGLDYSEIFKSFPNYAPVALLAIDNIRPPLFHLCLAVVNILFGNSIIAYAMLNIFFAAVLFFSVYCIGKKLRSETTGLLSVFILGMYPFVFGLSRMIKTNFASMALSCVIICCLFYTDKFRKTIPSILLGLSIGIASLIRLQFIFFIIGPLGTLIIIMLFDKEIPSLRKKAVLNFILSGIAAALSGGIWYLMKLPSLLKAYLSFGFSYNFSPVVSPKLFSLSSLTFYLRSLINGQLTPFFSLIFLIGLFILLKKRKLNSLLISWIIIPYFIFTLISFKEARITSEYLPAFALITAEGILLIDRQWLKRFLILIIIFGGLAQYFLVSFTNPSFTRLRISFFTGKLTEGLTVSSYLYPLSEVNFHYPRKGNWKIEDVISAIVSESPASNEKFVIGVTDACIDMKTKWFDPFNLTSWHENFITTNTDAISYFVRTRGLPYSIIGLSFYKGDWVRNPLFDFIVSVKKIEDIAPALTDRYGLILQTHVSDGSPVYVYKRAFGSR